MSEQARSSDPEVWVASGDREVRVSEMDDFHLLNAINYLRRRASGYAAQHGVDAGVLLQRIPQYPRMLQEVEHRGLAVTRSEEAKGAYGRFAGLIMEGQEHE